MAPVRATSGGADLEAAPAWSPDGAWIAFTRVVANSLKLSKVRPGGGEAPVDLAMLNSSSVPVWSPTGEWIAINEQREIWILDGIQEPRPLYAKLFGK